MCSRAAGTAFGTAYTTCGAALIGGDVHRHIVTRQVLSLGTGCLQAPQRMQQVRHLLSRPLTGFACSCCGCMQCSLHHIPRITMVSYSTTGAICGTELQTFLRRLLAGCKEHV
jgi:hypothetical protein